MKQKKKIGIDITEADGTPLSSGLEFYWDAGLAQILMQEASAFCPDVEFNQKERNAFETRFHKDTNKGVELCGASKSLENAKVRIPEKELDEFIAAIDRLHAKSERGGIPAENKAFMREFAVPNPLSMKSAWRVSTSFNQRLLVLWGYTATSGDAVVLPLTPTSAKWEDASRRVDLKHMLREAGLLTVHVFNWAKLFRWLLLMFLGIILAWVLLFAVKHAPRVIENLLSPSGSVVVSGPPSPVPPVGPNPENGGGNPGGPPPLPPSGPVVVSGPPSPVPPVGPNPENGGPVGSPGPFNPISPPPDGGSPVLGGGGKDDVEGKKTVKQESPKPDYPIIDYTFAVKMTDKKELWLGDKVDVTFRVAPIEAGKDVSFVVKSWSINGEIKASGDQKEFPAKGFSYKKRYVVSAVVTVDGREQKVLPFQWDCIATPCWMITRVGNNDRQYQVICTNSSTTEFEVENWADPTFRDAQDTDISKNFTITNREKKGDNKVEFSWAQEYVGEYLMSLQATIRVLPENGRGAKKMSARNTFVLVNGSSTDKLIESKYNLNP